MSIAFPNQKLVNDSNYSNRYKLVVHRTIQEHKGKTVCTSKPLKLT